MSSHPQPIQSVLDLFAAELAAVRFGDIDAESLARAAADVESSLARVAEAQVALDAARAALQERQDALLQLSQRALAYARIHAEADEALSARLDAIVLPRAPRRSKSEAPSTPAEGEAPPRPRGRPRNPPPAEAKAD